jgi:hypothetical protein
MLQTRPRLPEDKENSAQEINYLDSPKSTIQLESFSNYSSL